MFAIVSKKAASVINDARHMVNYSNYVTSDEHKNRMKTLPKKLRIPRDQWFNHKNWPGRVHMPNYHVHFRQTMQQVIKAIVLSFQTSSVAACRQNIQSALRSFQSLLRSLSGHVSIEERVAFPQMVRAHPNVNLKFLWEDHKELHQDADKLVRQLRQHIQVLASAPENKLSATKDASMKADTKGSLQSLPVPHVKAMLEAAGVAHAHCVNKSDLHALLTKHEATVMQEMKAALRLAAVSTAACVSKSDLACLYVRRVHPRGVAGVRVLSSALDFDRMLLSHLGEEEETVVPMELQDRPLH